METDAKFAAFVINPAIRRVVKKSLYAFHKLISLY